MSLPLCFSQTELLDGRDLALYILVPIPNTVCGAEALSKYPLTVKQVKEMGSTCHECRAVGYVLHLLALPYSVVMSVDACQEGGGGHRERGGGHGEARSGDALLPLQLADGWLSYGWLCFHLRCQVACFPGSRSLSQVFVGRMGICLLKFCPCPQCSPAWHLESTR